MSARLVPGQMIPATRYRIIAKVGQGAMGIVYAAEHVDLEKRVAIKLLASRVAQRPNALERFRHEARSASKIGSPYICDVTDFGELEDGRMFFVMEYLDGKSVRAVLDGEGPVPAARALPVLRQVAKALGAAHEKGIIHLDVKPDNVMLLERGRREVVKVVDFGVAGLQGDRPEPGQEDKVNGTPAYMAPERALGRGFDHRSDIYSLGIMAYEVLSGSIPFESDDIITTLRKHVHEPPEPLRDRVPDRKIPAQVEEVIFKLLAKDPADRPQSMAEVEALLCEAQIASRLTTAWDDLELPGVDEAWRRRLAAGMPRPWSRRAKALAGSMAVVATLGVAASLYLGFFHKRVVLVPVEVTRTDEPAAVAEELLLASRAAQGQRYVTPIDDSALSHIERAEQEAERLGVESPGARTLRQAYGGALAVVGDNLLQAGLRDLAIAKFKESLLFDASNPEVQRKAELTPGERTALARRTPGQAVRPSVDDQAKGLAASLFIAAREGNISEARALKKALGGLDRGGGQQARLADSLRPLARAAWADGRTEESKSLYGLVAELDPGDGEARERARVAVTRPAPVMPAAVAAVTPTSPPSTRGGVGPVAVPRKAAAVAITPVLTEPQMPRNPSASRAAVEAANSAMSRGLLDQAETAFRRAIRADPLNPGAVGGVAEVAFERARYAEALDFARRASKLAPRSPRYLMILGDAYFKLLRFDEARSAYERALTLAPQDQLLRARIARVKTSAGEK